MGLEHRISRFFTVEEIIPAAGQGIIALQGRAEENYAYLNGYIDRDAAVAASCERAFVGELNGGCTSPVCAYAEVNNGSILLRGLYYEEGTGNYRVGELSGDTENACEIGVQLARSLRDMRGGI